MPRRRRSQIGRRTRHSSQIRLNRSNQDEGERLESNELARQRMARSRSNQNQEQREERIESVRVRNRRDRERNTERDNQNRQQRRRSHSIGNLDRAGFNYDHNIDYASHPSIQIGKMDKVCNKCNAFKFKNETDGMCCAGGKVKLTPLSPPPEPLFSLVGGRTNQSKHFLKFIQSYNCCFQMTSFGVQHIVRDRFMPTFKVNNVVFNSDINICFHLYENSNQFVEY